MTEVNDHLKLLFARAAALYCRHCSRPVRRDTVATITDSLIDRAARAGDPRLVITFPVAIPANFSEAEVEQHLLAQGYTKVHAREQSGTAGSGTTGGATAITLAVVQDRVRMGATERARVADAIEAALARGQGRLSIHVLAEDGSDAQVWRYSIALSCADCNLAYSDPLPSLFSFNSPIGACDTCRGFGRVIGIDLGLVIPDENKTLAGGAVRPWQTESFKECQADLVRLAKAHGVDLNRRWRDLSEADRRWVIEGADDWTGKWKKQWYGINRFFAWLESKAYKMHIRVLLSRYRSYTPCTICNGARLKPDALLWRVGSRDEAHRALGPYRRYRPMNVDWTDAQLAAQAGLSIHDVMLLPIDRIKGFFDTLRLPAPLDEATDLLLTELRSRLAYLGDVGLGYLTLDRQSRTLSGGEVQRINLTTALGTSLVNTLFVLDEPSIGLHPRDINRVIGVMQRLRDSGNSLVVVEHDPQVMFAADRILDIGPGPGERGGNIVFYDHAAAIRSAHTLTGDYLANRRQVDPGIKQAVGSDTPRLVLEGAREHNLKNVQVEIPLSRLVVLSGVSGSGKSTLMQDVLLPALLKSKGKPAEGAGELDRLLGADWIGDVVFVNQSQIGKTTRSNPVSYVGAFDPIRKRFAATEAARERGYTAGTFSFNSGDGRCPTCGGNGFEHVEMQFLSDVYLRCPDCDGKRFRSEILEIRIDRKAPEGFAGSRSSAITDAGATGGAGAEAGPADSPPPGLSIADVLELTVSQAVRVFAQDRDIRTLLQPLADVGLDYLKLGQPVPTLSGGEAQRLKLAGFLAQAAARTVSEASRQVNGRGGTLFMFDEPTTGLHFDDVAKLLRSFRKLLAAGHSLLVIEHNLDVIRAADWVIDLGPEGGDAGGEVVATGTPDAITQQPRSHTGRALLEYAAQMQAGEVIAAAAGAASQADAMRASASQPAALPPSPTRPTPLAAEPRMAYTTEKSLQSALRERGRRSIFVHNAREHNLKNIDVEVPRDKMTVITGVSGSGKSTLAFDVIFGEGQRRYLESLNAYARQFVQPSSRPDVDAIFGIPPTVAIEQRTSRGGRKSTVATLTEIYHFLRLLYVKLGQQYCPKCNIPIEPQSFDAIVARILRDYRGQRIGLLAPLVVARKGVYTDLAKWAKAKGFSHLRVDGRFLPTAKFPRIDRYVEHNIELPVADLQVDARNESELRAALTRALEFGKGIVLAAAGLDRLAEAIGKGDTNGESAPLDTRIFSTKRACRSCGTSFAELDPRLFSFNSKLGWCATCFGTGAKLAGFDAEQSGEEGRWLDEGSKPSDADAAQAGPLVVLDEPCPACDGQRLNPTALAVRLQGQSIAEVTAMPVTDCGDWLGAWQLSGRESEIGRDVLAEIGSRLRFLGDVGLGYLSLDRSAPTLSGGEAQRIRLAAQLGSNLQGVCYVLDEPTIGLHPRDNRVLLDTLDVLKAKGNTLLVVEHDEETIRRADHIIDIGPGAGKVGGRIVATGTYRELSRNSASLTGKFLAQPLPHPLVPHRPVTRNTPSIRLCKATQHNLKNIDVQVPLARLTVFTGVSGSGKSTAARDVLLANLRRLVSARNQRKALPAVTGCARVEGWEPVTRVLEVDQTPIGKTPRSCPATYVGFWDAIRRLFADTTEARVRGYSASRFSFNTAGGRCESCEGQGMQRIEMSFLPDVKVLCDVCGGRRFNRETMAVKLRGASIGDVLAMNIDEAVEYFAAHRSIQHPLKLMQEVGLGYLTLGQPSPTLSGGEAQRIKLVTELAKVRDIGTDLRAGAPHTVYVLDEPTVGLHMADVEKLIRVMHRLVDAGNTLVVVEHNLDIWSEADWIVDLGPEGGAAGGRVVSSGSPEQLAARGATHTERVLAQFIEERAQQHAAVA